MDIGIGGSKIAGIPEKVSPNVSKRNFGQRNRSIQPQPIGSDLKPGKATEL